MSAPADPKGLEAAARAYARQMGKDPDACAFGHGEVGVNGGTFVCDVTHVEACTPSARQVVLAYLTATQPAGEVEAGIVGRLHKRADQLGMLLSDPPKPHPDAVLIREAAAALAAAIRERDEARAHHEHFVAEVELLRGIVSECASATGAGIASSATIDFMAKLPDEIRMVMNRKDHKLTALQRDLDQAREALRKLANEVCALSAFEAAVREAIGNTNYSVLMLRRDEARTVLQEDGK